MPELPEVETLRSQLVPRVEGHRIEEVLVAEHPRYRPARPAAARSVEKVRRRGKYLILELDDGSDLVLHLGMTGQLLWSEQVAGPGLHVHLGLRFATGVLWFRDPRRFGRAVVLPRGDHRSLPTLHRLGPEPDDEEFTVGRVFAFLGEAGPPVKARLLEQRLVAGVGNYLADEVLWRARISPFARSLDRNACRRLHRALRHLVAESIALGGVSERDYVHIDGGRGGFAARLKVHGRAGQPCRRCDTPLRRSVVAGRGTIWCDSCQPG